MTKEEFCNLHNEELLNYACNKVAEELKHKITYCHSGYYYATLDYAIYSVADLADEEITLAIIDYSQVLGDVFDFLDDPDMYDVYDDTSYNKEDLTKWAHEVIDDSLSTNGCILYIDEDLNNLSNNTINTLIKVITNLKDSCICPIVLITYKDNDYDCDEMLTQLKNLIDK